MNFLRLALTILLVSTLCAQTSDPTAARSALALTVSALGGSKLAQINSAVAKGNVTLYVNGQPSAGTFAWKNEGWEYRYETNVDKLESVLVSGHGSPARQVNGEIKRQFGHVSLANLPQYLPALVLANWLNDKKRLAASRPTLDALQSDQFKGKQVLAVSVRDNADELTAGYTNQRWLIDSTTGLPLAAIHQVPEENNAANLATFREEFSDYRYVNGVAVPFHIDSYRGSTIVASYDLSNVDFNTDIPDSEFELAGGGN